MSNNDIEDRYGIEKINGFWTLQPESEMRHTPSGFTVDPTYDENTAEAYAAALNGDIGELAGLPEIDILALFNYYGTALMAANTETVTTTDGKEYREAWVIVGQTLFDLWDEEAEVGEAAAQSTVEKLLSTANEAEIESFLTTYKSFLMQKTKSMEGLTYQEFLPILNNPISGAIDNFIETEAENTPNGAFMKIARSNLPYLKGEHDDEAENDSGKTSLKETFTGAHDNSDPARSTTTDKRIKPEDIPAIIDEALDKGHLGEKHLERARLLNWERDMISFHVSEEGKLQDTRLSKALRQHLSMRYAAASMQEDTVLQQKIGILAGLYDEFHPNLFKETAPEFHEICQQHKLWEPSGKGVYAYEKALTSAFKNLGGNQPNLERDALAHESKEGSHAPSSIKVLDLSAR
jgi:hypothetical protein